MKKYLLLSLMIILIITTSGCLRAKERYINQTTITHLVCEGSNCIEEEGEGLDQCSSNLDCFTPSHFECINSSCVLVEGEGTDKCTTNASCTFTREVSGGGSSSSKDNPPQADPEPPITEFALNAPVSSAEAMTFTLEIFQDLNVNRIRMWENWMYREPEINNENWGPLDERINFFHSENIKIILTLKPVGITSSGDPVWYCNTSMINENSCVFLPEYEQDFKDYLDNITTRYAGKIDKIQFANEWGSDYHFIGTAEDYVKYNNWLYDITKQNSPSTIVSLGPITRAVPNYVAICKLSIMGSGDVYFENGTLFTPEQIAESCLNPTDRMLQSYQKVKYVFENADYDMVDVHLYDNPEYWDEYLEATNYLLDGAGKSGAPIIVTEFGGPTQEDLRYDATNETFQAEELVRYMNKIIELQISEAYFHTLIQSNQIWIAHPLSGLMKILEDETIVEKPTYDVFKSYTIPTTSPEKPINIKSIIIYIILGTIILIVYFMSSNFKKKIKK
ncbi:hypothetical protein K8R33_00185 [archaeon]|nr:hypothetical protein [archaeon]